VPNRVHCASISQPRAEIDLDPSKKRSSQTFLHPQRISIPDEISVSRKARHFAID
jgi:hypothetical protein